jgi:hypothetical protein
MRGIRKSGSRKNQPPENVSALSPKMFLTPAGIRSALRVADPAGPVERNSTQIIENKQSRKARPGRKSGPPPTRFCSPMTGRTDIGRAAQQTLKACFEEVQTCVSSREQPDDPLSRFLYIMCHPEVSASRDPARIARRIEGSLFVCSAHREGIAIQALKVRSASGHS